MNVKSKVLYAVFLLIAMIASYAYGMYVATPASVVLPASIEVPVVHHERVIVPITDVRYIVDTVEICSSEPVVLFVCAEPTATVFVATATATAYVDDDPVQIFPPTSTTQPPIATLMPTATQMPTAIATQIAPTATAVKIEPTPTAVKIENTPVPQATATDKQKCNNGLGNGPDCPPPGHDKNRDGIEDDEKGNNDDDRNEHEPGGDNGHPLNNTHNH